jgi:LysR family nitrogen assimilation transcriptional regulator
MNLRYARTFVTVAELGTVSKAATRLRIAQPALSRQISAFEQELGLKLFDRAGNRLVLTSEGEQLLKDCRVLLNYASALSERAQLLRGGDTGVLKIAASPQIVESVLADFLHAFSGRYPDVQVKLVEALGWPETAAMLERGEIHLGQNLLRAVQPEDPRFGCHPLEAIDLLAVGHPSLLRDPGETIEISRLAAYPLLLMDGSFAFRRNFDAACRLARFEPSIRFESRGPYTLLAMAERGHGVAVIASAFRTDRHALRIQSLTYRGKPLRETLAVFWDKRRPLPRYAVAFCEMLAEHMRETFPITRPSKFKVAATARNRSGRSGKRSRSPS